jgi:hypothetical protein
MQRRVDLDCRPEEGEVTDPHPAHIQNDAVEVEEDPATLSLHPSQL